MLQEEVSQLFGNFETNLRELVSVIASLEDEVSGVERDDVLDDGAMVGAFNNVKRVLLSLCDVMHQFSSLLATQSEKTVRVDGENSSKSSIGYQIASSLIETVHDHLLQFSARLDQLASCSSSSLPKYGSYKLLSNGFEQTKQAIQRYKLNNCEAPSSDSPQVNGRGYGHPLENTSSQKPDDHCKLHRRKLPQNKKKKHELNEAITQLTYSLNYASSMFQDILTRLAADTFSNDAQVPTLPATSTEYKLPSRSGRIPNSSKWLPSSRKEEQEMKNRLGALRKRYSEAPNGNKPALADAPLWLAKNSRTSEQHRKISRRSYKKNGENEVLSKTEDTDISLSPDEAIFENLRTAKDRTTETLDNALGMEAAPPSVGKFRNFFNRFVEKLKKEENENSAGVSSGESKSRENRTREAHQGSQSDTLETITRKEPLEEKNNCGVTLETAKEMCDGNEGKEVKTENEEVLACLKSLTRTISQNTKQMQSFQDYQSMSKAVQLIKQKVEIINKQVRDHVMALDSELSTMKKECTTRTTHSEQILKEEISRLQKLIKSKDEELEKLRLVSEIEDTIYREMNAKLSEKEKDILALQDELTKNKEENGTVEICVLSKACEC